MPGITNLAAKAALNIKITEIKTKVPGTTGFITTHEFNRVRKITFDAKMKEATKSLASQSKTDNALDKADKNRKK